MKMWGMMLASLAAALTACSSDPVREKRDDPLVHAAMPTRMQFVDRIDAVGTARANEQVVLASPVTARIVQVNFADGQPVRKGQVIAVLAQSRQIADREGARAQAINARQQLDRVVALKAHGFVTNAIVDAKVAALNSARATVDAANAAIDDRVIRAPFSGLASLRSISAGAVVNQGTPIVTISDPSRIKLDFAVPETLMAALKPGVRVAARSEAYPGITFTGAIEAVDAVIDPSTRAVMARAILPNAGGPLKPGMLLNVQIEVGQRQALAVPELAIVTEGSDQFVYVIDREGKARRRPVKIGARQADQVEVTEGLLSTDLVIDKGLVKVGPGMKVRTEGKVAAQ
ncbi:membrane fusion protein (multidrug efflux system) [Novosphingobium kunmingense]|uniref:Membrane fusion protein (Multidrug efflux system) n=2 Tax=Novosphingobium kunmingense TaxID=1211806 RepID=A0A2N0HJA7_9SPHN|nr:membrane fusion protein (multidrug efflux system) [Novosphingobium kunmingense]